MKKMRGLSLESVRPCSSSQSVSVAAQTATYVDFIIVAILVNSHLNAGLVLDL